LAQPLLIVEDDENIARQLRWALADEYEVHWARDGEEAVRLFTEARPKVATLDLGLPPDPEGASVGLGLLPKLLALDSLAKLVVVTGNSEKGSALEAVRKGAYDYYLKPIELDELKVILKRAFHIRAIEEENQVLQRKLANEDAIWSEMLGVSERMQEVFATIRKAAPSELAVLVTGDSGTGKELASRAIHNLSPRKDGPFQVINCGAIPENLLEAELFGHEKGAFTGAHIQRRGRLEYAAGGTVFLDEIGELSLPLQVKLLRFLQERTLERVGGREAIEVDARLIAATNRELKQAVAEGKFREDLYYRLSVITLELPPLRERGEDMMMLARHFLTRFLKEQGTPGKKSFGQDALRAMAAYGWPGNVRELENRIRRAIIMSEGAELNPRDLDLPGGAEDVEVPSQESLRDVRDRAEAKAVRIALDSHGYNITRAAAALGVSRPTMHDLIKKHGLRDRS